MNDRRLPYLNFGCGGLFHPSWVNADLHPASAEVLKVRFAERLPFEDGTFEVAYHSHVLEHFPLEAARFLLAECRRVVRPGGTIRVVVPDLEFAARTYLDSIAGEGSPDHLARHRFAVIHLIDLCARNESGGQWDRFLLESSEREAAIAAEISGAGSMQARESLRAREQKRRKKKPLMRRAFTLSTYSHSARRMALRLMGVREEDWRAGLFRRKSGEPHLWMYDRVSLSQMLIDAGFAEPKVCGPAESRIRDWGSFHLDVDAAGRVIRPNSLYMEATAVQPNRA